MHKAKSEAIALWLFSFAIAGFVFLSGSRSDGVAILIIMAHLLRAIANGRLASAHFAVAWAPWIVGVASMFTCIDALIALVLLVKRVPLHASAEQTS